jgi:hypothetical protein
MGKGTGKVLIAFNLLWRSHLILRTSTAEPGVASLPTNEFKAVNNDIMLIYSEKWLILN